MDTITHDLTLGEPQVAGPLAVFPIVGPAGKLAYRSFAAAIELGAFVKELDEGASVGNLLLQNPTDLALLVYEGEEVLGAQQNRSFDSPVLVGAGARLPESRHSPNRRARGRSKRGMALRLEADHRGHRDPQLSLRVR